MIIRTVPAWEALNAERAGQDSRPGSAGASAASADGTAAAAPSGAARSGYLDGVVVVEVCGEVDLYTGPALRSVLEGLLPPPPPSRGPGLASDGVDGGSALVRVRAVVVDLRQVGFIDSFALGVLVHGHRLARPGGRAYALVSTNDLIDGLFKLTGLVKVLPLHSDLATALHNLRPAAPSIA